MSFSQHSLTNTDVSFKAHSLGPPRLTYRPHEVENALLVAFAMNMDTQTCVIDASTLIDHIHQIKALVYDGHIHLAVPISSTSCVPSGTL